MSGYIYWSANPYFHICINIDPASSSADETNNGVEAVPSDSPTNISANLPVSEQCPITDEDHEVEEGLHVTRSTLPNLLPVTEENGEGAEVLAGGEEEDDAGWSDPGASDDSFPRGHGPLQPFNDVDDIPLEKISGKRDSSGIKRCYQKPLYTPLQKWEYTNGFPIEGVTDVDKWAAEVGLLDSDLGEEVPRKKIKKDHELRIPKYGSSLTADNEALIAMANAAVDVSSNNNIEIGVTITAKGKEKEDDNAGPSATDNNKDETGTEKNKTTKGKEKEEDNS
ncbi:hypothetical protein M758_UG312200 [Ceratodon purpureus]|nr:hypothetical protein M758_UG312200 [Ceratodon purpureus]